jgi:hypothetical protein
MKSIDSDDRRHLKICPRDGTPLRTKEEQVCPECGLPVPDRLFSSRVTCLLMIVLFFLITIPTTLLLITVHQFAYTTYQQNTCIILAKFGVYTVTVNGKPGQFINHVDPVLAYQVLNPHKQIIAQGSGDLSLGWGIQLLRNIPILPKQL